MIPDPADDGTETALDQMSEAELHQLQLHIEKRLERIARAAAGRVQILPDRFIGASYINVDTCRAGIIVGITRNRLRVQYSDMPSPVTQDPNQFNILIHKEANHAEVQDCKLARSQGRQDHFVEVDA